MKRNGFTLVELLIVIIILGLILTLSVTSLLSSSSQVTSKLSDQQKKSIEDSAKLLALDLDNYRSEIYNCKSSSWMSGKCTDTSSPADGIWDEVVVELDELKEYEYFQDTSGHCTGGEVTILKGSGEKKGEYIIELSDDIKC